MKKIQFYAVIIPAMFMLLFTSCLKHDGENSQTFVVEPVIVAGENPVLLSSIYPGLQRFLAPDLTGKVERGNFLLVSFKINFDNQPDKNYYTAIETSYVTLQPAQVVVEADTNVVDGYDTPIVASAVHISNSGKKALIDDQLFMAFTQKENKTFEYKMVYLRLPGTTALPDLYISAHQSGDTPSNIINDRMYLQVFDLDEFKRYLIDELGLSGTKNIKIHCRGEDEEGKAYFKEWDSIDIDLSNT
jgi:hypothetical protein